MKQGKVNDSRKWATFYRSGVGYTFPDENVVRLVRGKYADIPGSGRVLDVGFGSGSNLIMFAHEGFEAYGLEVHEDIIRAAKRLAAQTDTQLHLSLLTGTDLPFPDSHFDILLSWNAVYYHGTRSRVSKAIDEFHRVLRPDGVLLLSVIHPNSFMVPRLSDDLGNGKHEIIESSPHDNRVGMKIFYDGRSSAWRRLLASFEQVEEGYVEFDLFAPARRNAWRLFLARKGVTEQ